MRKTNEEKHATRANNRTAEAMALCYVLGITADYALNDGGNFAHTKPLYHSAIVACGEALFTANRVPLDNPPSEERWREMMREWSRIVLAAVAAMSAPELEALQRTRLLSMEYGHDEALNVEVSVVGGSCCTLTSARHDTFALDVSKQRDYASLMLRNDSNRKGVRIRITRVCETCGGGSVVHVKKRGSRFGVEQPCPAGCGERGGIDLTVYDETVTTPFHAEGRYEESARNAALYLSTGERIAWRVGDGWKLSATLSTVVERAVMYGVELGAPNAHTLADLTNEKLAEG